MIFNSLIIPTLIYYLNESQFFELKSDQQKDRLIKYFIYLTLNTLILPTLRVHKILVLAQEVTKVGGIA